jgi:hypothetical protein
LDGHVNWSARLLHVTPHVPHKAGAFPAGDPGAVWSQALTAHDFLLQPEADVLAHVKDLVVPGCITAVSAPRASGKSLVALYLGVALATGGVFRDEQLTQRRVLLVDRDNPPSLVRKRLRWLGAHQVTMLKVLTREAAPPLTDKTPWAQFPVEDYDVVIMDSLGAATEGVSEREGRQTQEFLATLKDLARRGPALLCLDNTNKAGNVYRGRGETADAVDILYECRNLTGWTPTHGGDWWEDLPDFGGQTWQARATRRKGQAVLRIAFIPTKYRLGIEPEPFVLDIDTRQEPWTLADVTEEVATASAQAAQEASRQDRARITRAEEALVQALTARAGAASMLKREAETLLCDCGLTHKVARTLLESGGNRDVSPAGRWVLRPLSEHNRATGIFLAGEENDVRGKGITEKAHKDTSSGPSSSDDGLLLDVRGTIPSICASNNGMNTRVSRTQPVKPSSEDGTGSDEQPCGSDVGGISSDAHIHTSAARGATGGDLAADDFDEGVIV